MNVFTLIGDLRIITHVRMERIEPPSEGRIRLDIWITDTWGPQTVIKDDWMSVVEVDAITASKQFTNATFIIHTVEL